MGAPVKESILFHAEVLGRDENLLFNRGTLANGCCSEPGFEILELFAKCINFPPGVLVLHENHFLSYLYLDLLC